MGGDGSGADGSGSEVAAFGVGPVERELERRHGVTLARGSRAVLVFRAEPRRPALDVVALRADQDPAAAAETALAGAFVDPVLAVAVEVAGGALLEAPGGGVGQQQLAGERDRAAG